MTYILYLDHPWAKSATKNVLSKHYDRFKVDRTSRCSIQKSVILSREVRNWLRSNIRLDRYSVDFYPAPIDMLDSTGTACKDYYYAIVSIRISGTVYIPGIKFLNNDDFFLFRMTWL